MDKYTYLIKDKHDWICSFHKANTNLYQLPVGLIIGIYSFDTYDNKFLDKCSFENGYFSHIVYSNYWLKHGDKRWPDFLCKDCKVNVYDALYD